LQREAMQCIDALDSAKVFFYADPLYEPGAFDCSPFCRFADVDLFVYAGHGGAEDALWNLLQSLQDQPSVSDQLGVCSRASARGRLAFRRQEAAMSPICKVFPPIQGLPLPEWAIMTKLSRRMPGEKHEFWLLCIGGDPVTELGRLCLSRSAAPNYLALDGRNGPILHCA